MTLGINYKPSQNGFTTIIIGLTQQGSCSGSPPGTRVNQQLKGVLNGKRFFERLPADFIFNNIAPGASLNHLHNKLHFGVKRHGDHDKVSIKNGGLAGGFYAIHVRHINIHGNEITHLAF